MGGDVGLGDDIALPDLPPYTAPGVTWYEGGALVTFRPTPINQVNNVNIRGTPYILNQEDEGGLGTGATLLGLGAAGVVACTPGLLGAVAGLFPKGAPVWEPVLEATAMNDTIRENFLDCVARAIARVAINQITIATVDWINSGFDGKPAFVQDYQKFFMSVADKAAGEFIQGSGLSFLCSPFQLQVRIAIAQSYATRRSGSSNQCTLNGIVGNVEEFLDGNFSQGGWRGLISLTTQPTNNPFGAFMYAQVSLNDRILYATGNANRKISDGGFLAHEKCVQDGPKGQEEEVCTIVTPGKIIEERIQQVLDLPIDQNLLADSFDEIISALMNQLVIKTLQNGLTSWGSTQQISNPLDAQAMAAAQQLLTNLQGAVSLAQQYGAAQQGSIGDIQNAQSQLTELQNCYLSKGQSAEAASVSAQIQSLETRISGYNTRITRANTAITKVQQLQTKALRATSLQAVQAVQAELTAAQNSGQLITQAEVTSAQQDRTTLQSEMTAINNQTNARLNQCNATI